MTQHIPYLRCELPTTDMLVINHDTAGMFALVDQRVPAEQVTAMLQVMVVDMALRPELVPPEVDGDAEAARVLMRRSAAAQATRLTREARPGRVG